MLKMVLTSVSCMYLSISTGFPKGPSVLNDALARGSISLKGSMRVNSFNPYFTAPEIPLTSHPFKQTVLAASEVM